MASFASGNTGHWATRQMRAAILERGFTVYNNCCWTDLFSDKHIGNVPKKASLGIVAMQTQVFTLPAKKASSRKWRASRAIFVSRLFMGSVNTSVCMATVPSKAFSHLFWHTADIQTHHNVDPVKDFRLSCAWQSSGRLGQTVWLASLPRRSLIRFGRTQNTRKTRRAELKNNAREKMEGSMFQRPAMMLTAQVLRNTARRKFRQSLTTHPCARPLFLQVSMLRSFHLDAHAFVKTVRFRRTGGLQRFTSNLGALVTTLKFGGKGRRVPASTCGGTVAMVLSSTGIEVRSAV